MLKEFKEFALRGNVLDMAIGIILGVAFSKIVTSFVEDVLMPPLGMIIGKVDFSNLFLSLTDKHFDSVAAAKAAPAPPSTRECPYCCAAIPLKATRCSSCTAEVPKVARA